MIRIHYQKRNNSDLFKSTEKGLGVSHVQNYVPIYTQFFSLNATNYNHINLNHPNYLTEIRRCISDNIYVCKLKNMITDKPQDKRVFFKLAPLLDPYKYMIGKYDISNQHLFQLPKLNSNGCHPKMTDVNNCAYVDSLFLYLSSQLIYKHKFIHGVDFYGSFLAIKNNFKINVFDDLDYLTDSDFFNKHKHSLFHIDNYVHSPSPKQTPIQIGHAISLKSIQSVDNNMFEDIFSDEHNDGSQENDLETTERETTEREKDKESNEREEEKESNEREKESGGRERENELIEMLPEETHMSLKSTSSCSSRSSHTNDDDSKYESDSEREEGDEEDDEKDNEECSEYEDYNSEEDEEEVINVTIPKFPVQIIGMECCENTLDSLIDHDEFTTDEQWFSALMQIIMILITYQKTFKFTHNDLHTNNIMYNHTDKPFLYYIYNKKTYKVPTFGRIFKIIDFGRSIFRFGKLFCSDSFQHGGDAATQYNTEPYFNDKKPRLEPNFSFDLCRLACSMFDYLIGDFEEVHTHPVKKLIFEWCLDDKQINMLYKNNGSERYPEFKLYKMIARCVHNHIPHLQLERPEFSQFEYKGSHKDVMNIDAIPCYA